MPLPICGQCNKEMRVAKNEVLIREKKRYPTAEMIWFSDKLECPTCGHSIYTQFGRPMQKTGAEVDKMIKEYDSVEFTR